MSWLTNPSINIVNITCVNKNPRHETGCIIHSGKVSSCVDVLKRVVWALAFFFFGLYQTSPVRDVTWWMLIVRFQVMCTTPYLRFEKQTSASSWNSSPSPFLSDVPPEPNGLWNVWQDVIYRRENVCSVNCRAASYRVKESLPSFICHKRQSGLR